MMKKSRRLMCAIFAVLLLSLTACNSTVTSPPPTANDGKVNADQPVVSGDATEVGQTSSGSRELQPVPEGDWKQPYETMVNVTTAKVAGLDQIFENGDDQTDNPWTSSMIHN